MHGVSIPCHTVRPKKYLFSSKMYGHQLVAIFALSPCLTWHVCIVKIQNCAKYQACINDSFTYKPPLGPQVAEIVKCHKGPYTSYMFTTCWDKRSMIVKEWTVAVIRFFHSSVIIFMVILMVKWKGHTFHNNHVGMSHVPCYMAIMHEVKSK